MHQVLLRVIGIQREVLTTPPPRMRRPSRRRVERTSKRSSVTGDPALRGPWRGTRGPTTQSGDGRDEDRSEGPETGRTSSKPCHKCLVDDLKLFRATGGSTKHSPLVFGVQTALWPMAANEASNCTGGTSKQPNGSWSGGTRMRKI